MTTDRPGTLSCPVCGDNDTRSLIVAAAARNIFSGFDLKMALATAATPAPDALRAAAQAAEKRLRDCGEAYAHAGCIEVADALRAALGDEP